MQWTKRNVQKADTDSTDGSGAPLLYTSARKGHVYAIGVLHIAANHSNHTAVRISLKRP